MAPKVKQQAKVIETVQDFASTLGYRDVMSWSYYMYDSKSEATN